MDETTIYQIEVFIEAFNKLVSPYLAIGRVWHDLIFDMSLDLALFIVELNKNNPWIGLVGEDEYYDPMIDYVSHS